MTDAVPLDPEAAGPYREASAREQRSRPNLTARREQRFTPRMQTDLARKEDMREAFSVAYDGPAIQDGSMDIRDLAPALLALGALCEETSRVVYGDSATVLVRVRAGFKRGSFTVDLELVRTLRDSLLSVLHPSPAGVTMTAAVMGVLWRTIQLITWARGRPTKSAHELADGNVSITFGDGAQVTVHNHVHRLYASEPARKEIARLVRPLERDGITVFGIPNADDGGIDALVKHADLPYCRASPATMDASPGVPSTDTEFEARYVITSPNFTKGTKWRLSDGKQIHSFSIEDDRFLEDVESHRVRFAKDDCIVARIRMRQWTTAAGSPKTEWDVVRVIEHIPAPAGPTQAAMPWGDHEPDE